VVYQNVPHHLRRNSEKMSTALPLRRFLSGQTEIGFIHNSRALERVVRAFATQMAARQTAQFIVNKRNQSFSRALIATPPLLKELAYT
jgi:hypothetical protein